jgi:hypothetical protein
MRIIPKSSPSPRLLNTVVSDVGGKKSEPPTGKAFLKTGSVFSGNGIAIFVGIAIGAAILSILGIAYTRHHSHKQQSGADALSTPIATANTRSADSTSQPATALLGQIRVSAISLGEPRLAIINDKQVTEGDIVIISIPDQSGAVTLRVMKIADGQVDLATGTQMITARVETPRGPNRSP